MVKQLFTLYLDEEDRMIIEDIKKRYGVTGAGAIRIALRWYNENRGDRTTDR